MIQKSLSDSQLRQTAAELLACAIVRTFPKAQIVRTEASEGGFFCDFAFEEQVDAFALSALSEQMIILARENPEKRITEMMRENAKEMLRHQKQFYLADQAIASLRNVIPLIHWGNFTNLLVGEVGSFSEIVHFKLLAGTKEITFVQGHGDVTVWRIHGVIFQTAKELKDFIRSYEKNKKTDHRLLGKELELFIPAGEASAGSWIWLPKGAELIASLRGVWKEFVAELGAHEVLSPPVINTLTQKQQNPYLDSYQIPSYTFEEVSFNPIISNASFHAEVFASRTHSYKELPFRTAEWQQVSNFFPSHHLKGTLRTRSQLQDTIHSFCEESKILKEINSSLQFIIKTIKILGFEPHWSLSSREKKSAGTPDNWNKCYEWLRKSLETFGESAEINTSLINNEGPVLYLSVKDHLNRERTLSSVGIN